MSSQQAQSVIPLIQQWRNLWPLALSCWSSYTLLREPIFFESDKDAAAYAMAGQIAAIRLQDQLVMVNLAHIRELKIENLALEVLAHEIGHHVYVPANLSDNARMIAAIRFAVSGLPQSTPHFVANLYGDLLINDRLQRRAGLNIAGVYQKLNARQQEQPSQVWRVYTRTYEWMWDLPARTLTPSGVSEQMNGDAALLARLIRNYSGDWLRGVRRFAFILYPYLVADDQSGRKQTFSSLGLEDTKDCNKAGSGRSDSDAIPDGIASIDDSEFGNDDDLDDVHGESRKRPDLPQPENTAPTTEAQKQSGQFREPFEYGEILKALGLDLSQHQVTTRYYRERALPHLIPFPARKAPETREPLAEGYESWDAGNDLDSLDVFRSVVNSPKIIPGVTTAQRVYGDSPGSDPEKVPLDLDIYVDCSGSMPNPAVSVSYLALAGTILALSALRAGARVQATLWSGPSQYETSNGFITDEKRILGIITGYIAGSTAFPLKVLRETYADRKRSRERPSHIVVISDEGVDTILQADEGGRAGSKICELALKEARAGGTLVLNIANSRWTAEDELKKLGFRVHRVTDWEALITFARAFVRENYGT